MCENENKISSKNNNDLNSENKKPLMVLTIEVGNNSCDKLMIYDIETREQETYDFCLKNKLDYSTMKEINNSINNIIKSNTLTSLKSNQKNITQQNINKPPISTSNHKIQQKIFFILHFHSYYFLLFLRPYLLLFLSFYLFSLFFYVFSPKFLVLIIFLFYISKHLIPFS